MPWNPANRLADTGLMWVSTHVTYRRGVPVDMTGRLTACVDKTKSPALASPGLVAIRRFMPAYHKGCEMNRTTMHGSITVNRRTVIAHAG